jgi:penicillin amidase
MRIVLRALRVLSGLLVLAGLLIAAGGLGIIWLTLPGSDLTASIPGLSAPVDVSIDADGIPWIKAATEQDATAALGFLHARERLFQMDLMRRTASGELSEIAGTSTLPIDRLMRTLGVRESAVADLSALPAGVIADLQAYARGVNAWIDRRGRFAAMEFVLLGTPRHWTPVDSLLWGKTMGLYLSGNWRTELARVSLSDKLTRQAIDELWPDPGGDGHPEAQLDPALVGIATRLASVLPTFPDPFTLPATASNAWVVAGQRSASGAPLLAGDPHLGFGLPGFWYLARIDTPDGTLAGVTAPGVPMLVMGHNGNIAWTFTTTGADVQDLFIETLAGEGKYATPDGPHPFSIREERIRVRGAPDEVLLVRETRHGPVVSDLIDPKGPILALSMSNLMPDDVAASGLLALNHARTVAEAREAAALITSPVQNLLVADHQDIGLFVTGRVPVRKAGDGAWPVPGADGAYDWTGWASGADLPHSVSPPSLRLVNANDRIAPPDFPVFLGRDWFGTERSRRIRELLDGNVRFGTAEFASMQMDIQSLVARDLMQRLRDMPAPVGPAKVAIALLRDWDGAMAMDRPQPLIFNAWMRNFHDLLLARIGVPRSAMAAVAPWPQIVLHALSSEGAHWCGGDCRPLLADSLASAVTDLAATYGTDPTFWRWGDAHEAVFAHPLLRFIPLLGRLTEARIAVPGDDTTLNRAGLGRPGFDDVHGPSFRGVYDLADLDHSLFMVAPGQSGHPASRLARNFLQRWRDGGTVMLGILPESVAARMRLEPREVPQ